jgi:hypothetical protein
MIIGRDFGGDVRRNNGDGRGRGGDRGRSKR